ncbi:glycosyltransferase [Gordonia sp. VNK1]|uniref:glycosyltransferase family 2 protein n=1 Tax=Gordonia oleivorans TaxID=3156618 RepID=UPI0032B34B28
MTIAPTGVAAVISAFEPDEALVATVDSVRDQAGQVIIVDDGSPSLSTDPDGAVAQILEKCAAAGATVLRSGDNRGIAHALNRGIELALQEGAEAVLTLDQDTDLPTDYVSRMLDHLALTRSLDIDLVMLSPSLINDDVAPFWFAHKGVTLAFEPIQSGMMFPRALLERVGLFDEGLFIDCVETEFYLRARALGAHAVIVPGTRITHRLGRAAQWTPPRPLRWILRGRAAGAIEFTEDAPFRHYYIARNRLTLYRRYARSEALWTAASISKDVFLRGRAMAIGTDRLSRIYLTGSGLRASLRDEVGRIPPTVLRRAQRLRHDGDSQATPPRERHSNRSRQLPELVSVVIPVFNARNVIDLQLDALADQTYQRPFEVIVADNGSTDGLRDHLSDHPLRDRLRLKWVDAGATKGSAHARNAGVAASDGDFVAFCDGDDRVDPAWLTELTRVATSYDAVGGAVETSTLNSVRAQSWRGMLPPEQPYEFPGFLRVSPTCNLGVWRDTFDRAGGFDTAYDRGGEDSDFTIRVQLTGGALGHAPRALVAYRLRDTLAGIWDQSVMCGEGDARLYSDYRHYGMPRRPWYATLDVIAYLLLRNPLLPTRLTRVPLGRWLFHAGNLLGRAKGSIRHRSLYI